MIQQSKAIHFNNKNNRELTHVERIVRDGPGHYLLSMGAIGWDGSARAQTKDLTTKKV